MNRLMITAAATISGFICTAYADDQKSVALSADEQKNVERVCDMMHRPGAAMRECIDEQTKKVLQGKQTQLNNQDMEALTTQQIGK